MPKVPPDGVPLTAAIGALRDEILRAYWDARQHPVRFSPAPIELTLEAAVTWTGEAGASVKWWLINLDGKASRESSVTQTIRMTLQPHLFDVNGQEIEEFLIDTPESPPRFADEDRSDLPLDAAE